MKTKGLFTARGCFVSFFSILLVGSSLQLLPSRRRPLSTGFRAFARTSQRRKKLGLYLHRPPVQAASTGFEHPPGLLTATVNVEIRSKEKCWN
jgi:hypothetical protein